jgi:hypothetical protein
MLVTPDATHTIALSTDNVATGHAGIVAKEDKGKGIIGISNPPNRRTPHAAVEVLIR